MSQRKYRQSWIRRHARWVVAAYVALVLASQLFQAFGPEEAATVPAEVRVVEVGGQRLAYREWGGANNKKDPIILLHGSPSRGSVEFSELGPSLATEGRRVLALDRWGYGHSERWVKDYSFEADERAVLGLMDQLGIRTAHLAGWSYGAAPALGLAQAQPGRIRSVTLLAGMGAQAGEGSGSYWVEHVKYAGLFVVAMGLPELLPHFGLLGSRHGRYAFARDFWDADQRKVSWALQGMAVPLLIVHGKDDPLVPAWVAQFHHGLKPSSRLVVLDSSHFFPMQGKSESLAIAAGEMRGFMTNGEEGKRPAMSGVRNETSRGDLRAMWDGGPPLRGPKSIVLLLVVGMVFGFFVPRTGGVLAGLGGGLLMFDFVTVLVAVISGAIIRRGQSTRPRKALLVSGWGIPASLVGMLMLGWF